MPDARLIKRYANRKLYDTHEKRYVTLLQIAHLVREGDEIKVRASIDVTAAWGDLVKSCVRRVESDEPAAFTVTDEVELPTEGRVSFNLHSKFPWVKGENGWTTCGTKAQLTVMTEWQVDKESLGWVPSGANRMFLMQDGSRLSGTFEGYDLLGVVDGNAIVLFGLREDVVYFSWHLNYNPSFLAIFFGIASL